VPSVLNHTILIPAIWNVTHNITHNITKIPSKNTLKLIDIPLFSPQYLPATTIICLILTWICSSAGIGGAALDQVVFIALMNLVPKEVSPITKALVFGESLGGYLINMRRRHPFIPRTLVNYEVALAFEPFSLLGTLWGVYANQSFPSYIILAGLILVLGFAAIRTFQKGFALWKAENMVKDEKADADNEEDPNQSVEVDKQEEEKKEVKYDWAWFTGKNSDVPFWPRKICFLLFINWVVLALFDVLVGTTALGVSCGTPKYWGGLAITFPVFIVIAVGMGLLLRRKYKKRRANGFEYTSADLKWTPRRVGVFLITSLLTGVLAAMFGLGGGTINSPMMLELGVLPAQVPATSGLLILLTSSVAIIQYLALGRIQYDYLLWFILVGFIGGISGHLGIRYYIKKYKKQSTIVFLLGCLVVAGMCVLIYTVATLFITHTAVMTIASPCASS